YKYIRRTFVFSMAAAILFFAFFLLILQKLPPFSADILEVIVFGGALLGMGAGLIIRYGGCTDGTEILAILINRKTGFTVGQIVLFINIFIFALYGIIFHNWHIALRSLMTYFVAFKMIDIVIEGLNELKSVMIITNKPQDIREIITNKLGLGLTIIPSIGGFSGENKEILYLIIERLDISELKEIVLKEDPSALLTIQNLHEVAYGKHLLHSMKKKRKNIFF
ncbi:MAG: YitT family protein, partial [Chlamydiota bacterium]